MDCDDLGGLLVACITFTIHKVLFAAKSGLLWSVAHESLIIFAGCHYCCVFAVEVLSQQANA
jgi:hypothetical protein